MEGEVEFFKYLMQEQSPKGILSVVSDTWDFWTLVTDYLPQLKNEIMTRDGTLVIRPDSGDPVKVLTGYTISPVSDYRELFATQDEAEKEVLQKGFEAYRFNGQYFGFEGNNTIELMECEVKGLIECLWGIFGGTTTPKGYKLLDEHIGAIYGDAITLTRQRQILQRLMDKGFASKVVLGIGSYSYQYVTRDTHGSAVKATSVVKAGERLAIFKDPKTDSKKKSAKGLLKIERVNGELTLFDDVTEQEESQGLLEVVFEDGKLIKETSLNEIRECINQQI
jgi:nicotinamide phosphoribosyltransferase